MKTLKAWLIGGGVLASIIIFLSLLLTALHVVEINHFGLKYRTLDYTVTDQIYGSGRVFSGIATSFIQYPTTTIIFEFSAESDADFPKLAAWTINGQSIYLEISFFAKFINKSNIRKFYFEFGENWKGFFVRMAYSKIKEITTEFQELDFYLQREMINQRLTTELSTLFLNQSNNMLNVTEVQLRKIELDPDLETAVEDKLIELQSQRKWQIQQNITMILKQTELIRQWAANNITLIYANATAIATNITMLAEANATKLEYEGYAQAYNTLIQNVNFANNDNALLSFMFAELISKFGNNTNLNIGFNKPGVLLGQPSSGN